MRSFVYGGSSLGLSLVVLAVLVGCAERPQPSAPCLEQADIKQTITHIVIPNRRQGHRFINDLRVHVEIGSLPLRIGAARISAITEQK